MLGWIGLGGWIFKDNEKGRQNMLPILEVPLLHPVNPPPPSDSLETSVKAVTNSSEMDQWVEFTAGYDCATLGSQNNLLPPNVKLILTSFGKQFAILHRSASSLEPLTILRLDAALRSHNFLPLVEVQ
jgi:hypothetical protein